MQLDHYFPQQNGIKFKEETSEMVHLFCTVLKLEHFSKCIRNTLHVLKCGTREGWRRSSKFHRFNVHFDSLRFFTPTHALSHTTVY
jgi:hypothetical protein